MWRQSPRRAACYPNFETVVRLAPMFILRATGGTLFTLGALVACYNLYRTARSGALVRDEQTQAPPLVREVPPTGSRWHRNLESRPVRFAVLVLVTVLVGGIVEFVPTALMRANIPTLRR
jgi:cytochrome c oxidase cbb3-type subunit I/II